MWCSLPQVVQASSTVSESEDSFDVAELRWMEHPGKGNFNLEHEYTPKESSDSETVEETWTTWGSSWSLGAPSFLRGFSNESRKAADLQKLDLLRDTLERGGQAEKPLKKALA
jgi:hypothetical protein